MVRHLTGALIGAGVALLVAPQPGTELRGRLGDYRNCAKEDLTDKGHEAWDTVVERDEEFYEQGRGLSGMPDGPPKNWPNTHKTGSASQDEQRSKTRSCLVMMKVVGQSRYRKKEKRASSPSQNLALHS